MGNIINYLHNCCCDCDTVDEKENELETSHQIIGNNQIKENKIDEQSKQIIHEFVRQLVNDENINVRGLPDFIEKKMYQNIITLLIALLEHTLETGEIKILGHSITFTIRPSKL